MQKTDYESLIKDSECSSEASGDSSSDSEEENGHPYDAIDNSIDSYNKAKNVEKHVYQKVRDGSKTTACEGNYTRLQFIATEPKLPRVEKSPTAHVARPHGVVKPGLVTWPLGYCVKVLWLCLSVLVSIGCSFSLVQPYWFTRSLPETHSVGPFTYCKTTDTNNIEHSLTRYSQYQGLAGNTTHALTDYDMLHCQIYGAFWDQLSSCWQAGSFLYAVGCVLLSGSCLLALLSLCVGVVFQSQNTIAKRLPRYTGCLQIIAVTKMALGLAVLPVGLTGSFIEVSCGPDARMFHGDQCHLDWAYMLAIMSTALATFTPVMGYFGHAMADDDDGEQSMIQQEFV